jgi:protein-S-isoprenylcysteine O-methyltransferase Ste14
VLANVSLIFLFGLQHTIMARLSFKRWWTRIVPPAAERSTFMMFTVGVFALMFSHWQAIPTVVWHVEHETARIVLYALFGLGWIIALLSTFLINHFDLFGLRQVYLYFTGQEYKPLPFKKIGLYKRVRHPLMLGFLIGFWAVPTMTVGHLVFSGVFTICILVGLFFEERDLATLHGPSYKQYIKETPMLLPVGK